MRRENIFERDLHDLPIKRTFMITDDSDDPSYINTGSCKGIRMHGEGCQPHRSCDGRSDHGEKVMTAHLASGPRNNGNDDLMIS